MVLRGVSCGGHTARNWHDTRHGWNSGQLSGNLCWGHTKAFRRLNGLEEFALRDGPRLGFKLASLSQPVKIKVHPQGVRALLWNQVQVPSDGSPGTSDFPALCALGTIL